MRTGWLGAVAVVGVVLAACTVPSEPAAPVPSAPGDTALGRAVGRLDGPLPDHLHVADTRALRDAPTPWSVAAQSDVTNYGDRLPEVLGIDLAAADLLVTAGEPPQRTTLVVGGQDAARVRDRAGTSGWGGDEVLRREPDLSEPLTVYASGVRPLGTDVAFGDPDALERVDGPGPALADDPAVAALVGCLGDAVVVVVEGRDDGVVNAVGLRRVPDDPDAAVNVLCTTGTPAARLTDAVTAGTTLIGQPWPELLQDPQVDELPGGLVRLVARTAPGASPGVLARALEIRDLPGR